jgi:hypothetical protein
MVNLSHPDVAKVASVSKNEKVITVVSDAKQKQQAFHTLSSGTSASLGSRIQCEVDFGAMDPRYIQDIKLRYRIVNSSGAGSSLIHLFGMAHFIEEVKIQLNGDRTIYLNQFQLFKYFLWEKYNNYSGNAIRNFMAEHAEALAGDNSPGTAMTNSLAQFQSTLAGGATSEYLYLPFSMFTELFNNCPTTHLHKFTIQIQLANPAAGSVQSMLTAGQADTETAGFGSYITFTDLELEIQYDTYSQFVHNPKGFHTVHDSYLEQKIYPITNANQVIDIRLNQDFSPMMNVKRLYMHTRPTTVDTTSPYGTNSKATGWLQHNSSSIGRIEILRNGQRYLDFRNTTELYNFIQQYYRNKHRWREYAPGQYAAEVDEIPTGFFLPLERSNIKHNNDKHQILKPINGETNYSERHGELLIRVYPNATGWITTTENELFVVASATRLIHLGGPSELFKVTDEM